MKPEKELQAGLLGEHLTHSFSPQIHKRLGGYHYDLFEVPPQSLSRFLKEGTFDALNVTIPYKEAVIPYLAGLSAPAARIGAVNTVVRKEDGSLFGYNTDYEGLKDLILRVGIPLCGKKVLILGTGGAAKTAKTVAEDEGAAEVVFISRKGENNYKNLGKHQDAAVIINATPVGMYPKNGVAPIDLNDFPHVEAVFDLIYNPARTALLLEAEKRNIPAAGGLFMLVSQARRSAELFLSGRRKIPTAILEKLVADIRRETENIILIGMPGCGKSTLGALLAEELGRPFVDADQELTALVGETIPEIFRREGERGFRAHETAVLELLTKESGRVIATGGGAVTREENYDLLHQNGKIVFLDIAPLGLAVLGRPLSLATSPERLYAERLPLYRRFADVTVPITHDIAENLKKIKEAVEK